MKNLIFTLAVSCLVCGCGTQRKLPTTTIQETTNSNVEVKYEKVFVHDTTYIEIPAQTAERTTRDSTSHLENDFAVSDAKINPDGSLFHELKTKPQKKPVPVDKEIERRDSVVYVDRHVEVPVPVERSLTPWERTCINWFPYSVAALILMLVYVFRKPMRSLIRRFI
ncbi:MAG: hypothetical protein Q4D56_06120 [Bacteroides sp.]|jgi:hypothetical protein|nr:hypothetical protein [Bacteroides sp.]